MSLDAEKILSVAKAQTAGDAETGASLCVIVGGKEIVNESWGVADPARGISLTADSLQMIMSVGKGVMGTLLAILVDRGLLDVEAPVSQYWPEFAAAGKGGITVAQLFSHQAGLAMLDGGLPVSLVADREALALALASQAPMWEPGTAHGYHAITQSCYADILFERVSGKGICELLAELGPQMGGEFYCGLPPRLWDRAVQLGVTPLPSAEPVPPSSPTSMRSRVLGNMPELAKQGAHFFTGTEIRGICLAGTNMFSHAASVARMYAGLLNGGVWGETRLCSPEAIAQVTRERVRGFDRVHDAEMSYGLCYQTPCASAPFSPNPGAFGHCGFGGSIGFADPEKSLAMSWIPSRFSVLSYDARMRSVISAVYSQL